MSRNVVDFEFFTSFMTILDVQDEWVLRSVEISCSSVDFTLLFKDLYENNDYQ